MRQEKSWFIASVAVSLIVAALVVAPGAWAASTYKILHAFRRSSGGLTPSGNLVSDTAGNLYGTTYSGGMCFCGVVFKLAPNPDGTWTEHVLYSFTGGSDGANPADGANPFAGVILDAAGNLYGTTRFGGCPTPRNCFDAISSSCGVFGGCGVVFKLAPNPDGTWTEHVLHRFTNGADGGFPMAGMILDAAGNLYGTTPDGGSSSCGVFGGCGVVFKLAPNPDGRWTEHVLHTFTGGTDGGVPVAGVILDAAGNLYGTTSYGGVGNFGQGNGVVFELTRRASGGWSERVLHAFLGYGASPMAGLIRGASGNLYGTAAGGTSGGLVFEIKP